MAEDTIIKYFTFKILDVVNHSATVAGRNRTLHFDKLPIHPDQRYPVTMAFPHTDVNQVETIRCCIELNGQGDQAWLDLTEREYNNLPQMWIMEREGKTYSYDVSEPKPGIPNKRLAGVLSDITQISMSEAMRPGENDAE